MQRYEPDMRSERPRAVDWTAYCNWAESSWVDLLAKRTAEEDFHQFLERNPSFLPGCIDNVGPGGHHGPWWDAVVSKPPLNGLGPDRIPDFMWLRRDTDATRPILIEIERPSKCWYTNKLVPTADLTQAMDQIYEWQSWFRKPANTLTFNETYVPRQFRSRDLRPQYVLIYGRTAEFRANGRHVDHERARRKRDLLGERNDIHFFTFDMLRPRVEAANYGTLMRKNDNFLIRSIPPTYQTEATLLLDGSLLDASSEIRSAVSRVPLLDEDRRVYLEERWEHWREIKHSEEWGQNRGLIQPGLE